MKNWALILGASSGFGAATAKKLASLGVNIYGVHLDRKSTMNQVDQLIKDLKDNNVEVVFKNVSATDESKREEILQHLISIDANVKILMHSLAFGALRPVIDSDSCLSQKQIEMTMDVMANSIVYWAQDLFKNNILQKGGHIFGMTSSGGHRQWKSYGAVSAAKASLESYCRQLAFELSEHNISSNAIQAGVTDTPALRKIPGNEIMIEHALSNNPGKRLTTPDDVANVISTLGLTDQTWLTGNTIRVDGGEDITG